MIEHVHATELLFDISLLFPGSRLGIVVEGFEKQFYSTPLAVFIIFSLLDVAILELVLKK